jgi:TIR domain
MDVFISWSGERSKYVAECLRVWFKQVIQMVKPWMSSEDILAGARWNGEIARHLSETKFGVICVTPENLVSAPWLTFEAGAIAKTIDERIFVCPLSNRFG